MPDYKFNRTTLVYLLPIALLIISLFVGRYQTPLSAVADESVKVFSSLFFGTPASVSTQHTVLFNVRLPRILAALLVGAALSIAGASFQGIFRNPLVSPYILGVGSGAGFGACGYYFNFLCLVLQLFLRFSGLNTQIFLRFSGLNIQI